MKTFNFLILFLSFSFVQAQIEVVTSASGNTWPSGFAVSGNDLYMAELFAQKITKVDITATLPSATTDVITGIGVPHGMAISGNELYYTEVGSGAANRIMKIDLAATTPTPVEVVSNLETPWDILIDGDIMYIVEVASPGTLSKVNITGTLPATQVDIITGFNSPNSLFLEGNDLYITEYNGSKVSKVDITATTPIKVEVVNTGLTTPTYAVVHGNYLYISDYQADKIYRTDITGTLPATPIEVVTSQGPVSLELIGDELYIAELDYSRIVKLDLTTLGIDDITLPNTLISVYPNPAKEYIILKDLKETQKINIINSIGALVKEEVVAPNQKINVQDLEKGVYFIQLNVNQTLKFIKE